MRKKLNEKVTENYIKAKIKAQKTAEGAVEKLSEDSGNFLEEALKYIIAIVVGGLFLAGVYALFKTVIIPSLQNKTQDMFNYTA